MSATAPLAVEPRAAGRHARLYDVRCCAGPDDRPYPEVHGGWAIALVRRGEFLYRAHDERRPRVLRSGSLLLGRPGQGYTCSHERAGGDDCTVVALGEELLDEAASATGVRPFSVPVLPPLPEVSARIALALADPAHDVDALAVDVARLVLAALRGQPRPARAVRPGDVERVRAALDLLEDRSEEPWTLGEVAAAVGASPFHFARVFRAVVGTSPHQYLIGARLRRAAALLLDTDRPVTEVALEVGFDDLSNFVRTFHRKVGRSPGAYRHARR